LVQAGRHQGHNFGQVGLEKGKPAVNVPGFLSVNAAETVDVPDQVINGGVEMQQKMLARGARNFLKRLLG
jgi:hypothetical protein